MKLIIDGTVIPTDEIKLKKLCGRDKMPFEKKLLTELEICYFKQYIFKTNNLIAYSNHILTDAFNDYVEYVSNVYNIYLYDRIIYGTLVDNSWVISNVNRRKCCDYLSTIIEKPTYKTIIIACSKCKKQKTGDDIVNKAIKKITVSYGLFLSKDENNTIMSALPRDISKNVMTYLV